MSYHDEVLVGFGEFLDKVGRQFGGALSVQTYMGITNKSQMKAKQLYQERLPGGGKSMADAVKFEVLENSADRWVGRLSCTHPWASAVETGTDPHEIPLAGMPALGGIGIKAAKEVAAKHGYAIPKDWRPEMKERTVEEMERTEYGKETIQQGGGVDYLGLYTAQMGASKPGKIETATTSRYLEKPFANFAAKFKAGHTAPRARKNVQATKAHEYFHMIQHHEQLMGRGKIYNRGPITDVAETMARAASDAALRKIDEGKTGKLVIEDWLPSRGGGKDSQTPPWGTRYVKNKQFFDRVKHPGARSFHVMRDTKNFMVGEIPKMIREFIEGFK